MVVIMDKIDNIVVINDFNYIQGGASKIAIETANLLANDYNVYFFSGDSREDNSLNENVKRICTNQGEALKNRNKIKGLINGLYNFKAKRELKRLLETLDYKKTIVHIHGWTKCLSSSIFSICKKKNFKVVLTLHDYFTICPNGGLYNYKKCDLCELKPMSLKCIFCNCDSRNYFFKLYRIIRQFIQNKIVGLDRYKMDAISISNLSEELLKKRISKNAKIHRVYNPVDFDRIPKIIDFNKNEYFLYVGRLSKEKGADIFCEAVTRAKQRGIVVGDGSELNYLKDKYSNIEFVGWKNSEDVKKYMKNAKALIFPSRWYETMGLTVVETMQYGIPVFVRKNTAACELVSEKNLFYSVEELVDLIKEFKCDCKPKLSLQNFERREYYKNIIKVYEEVL